MDEKVKMKWVKALRSGKYQQAQGYLRVKNDEGKFGYCCLGVLADVMGCEWKGYSDTIPFLGKNKIGDSNFLEDYILPRGTQNKLAEANDASSSFPKIAKMIESGKLTGLENKKTLRGRVLSYLAKNPTPRSTRYLAHALSVRLDVLSSLLSKMVQQNDLDRKYGDDSNVYVYFRGTTSR